MDAFKVESAALHYLQTRAALRKLLGTRLGIAPQQLSFETGEFGKPKLPDATGSKLLFNVSHTDGWAMIALSEGVEVGIDVERHNHNRDLEAVARRSFSAAEYETVMGFESNSDRCTAFFDTWTAKEACIKALGTGIASPMLKRFSVALGAPGTVRNVAFADDVAESGQWCLMGLGMPEGWSAAVGVRAAREGAGHFAHHPPALYGLDEGFWAETVAGAVSP